MKRDLAGREPWLKDKYHNNSWHSSIGISISLITIAINIIHHYAFIMYLVGQYCVKRQLFKTRNELVNWTIWNNKLINQTLITFKWCICNLSINVKWFFNYSWSGKITASLDMFEMNFEFEFEYFNLILSVFSVQLS